jgi:ectoine hydroxylase-related dioxygenase (phytanoyl-CoA dioxygenase family)
MQVRYQLRQRPVTEHLTTGPIPALARGRRSAADRAEPLYNWAMASVEGRSAATTVSPLPDLEDHLERVAKDGYTILPEAIEPDLLDEIDAALLRLEHDLGTVPADNLFEGVRTMRVYNLLAHGSTFQKIPVHANVLPVVEAVLDPGLLISSLSSIAIGPDEQAQPIHADDQLIPLTRPHVPIICNTMWAITDFTEENGATRLVPGSHLFDQPPNPLELYETIPAEMPRGSVLVWVGSLWHGGGANRTASRRVGIAMNYCAGYIRQQENQQLGLAPALVKTFPRRLQELVGYSVYNGLVGHIDKKHPAKVVLAENEDVDMVWDLLKT